MASGRSQEANFRPPLEGFEWLLINRIASAGTIRGRNLVDSDTRKGRVREKELRAWWVKEIRRHDYGIPCASLVGATVLSSQVIMPSGDHRRNFYFQML